MNDDMMKILFDNPEFCKKMIDEMGEKLKPILAALGAQGLGILEDVVNCKRYYDIEARHKRNAYVAYTEVGFTHDQAMALLLSDSIKFERSLNQITGSVKSGT